MITLSDDGVLTYEFDGPLTYSEELVKERIERVVTRTRENGHRNYQRHREICLERGRHYRDTHKEELKQHRRKRYQEHKEEVLARSRQFYLKYREKFLERCHQYYRDNRETRIEHSLRYQQRHPEVSKNAHRKRRALIAGSDGHFTEEEFKLLCEAFGNKCVYCHQELPLVPDHAVPLSRGGSNSIENIVPSCTSCNNKKYTMTYDEFLEYLVSIGELRG